MQIKSPKDLFTLYTFNEDTQLQIQQFFNADKAILLKINALALIIKHSPESFTKLHTNTYLAKMANICLVYQIQNENIIFIGIRI